MSQIRNILIAEDEKPLASALELKLTHEGFIVTVVHNGQECLDKLKSADFDVLLLDLMMPVVDGFQVLEQLKNHEPKPKVFVLSNLSQTEDEKRAKELGATDFFVKSNTPLSVIVEQVRNA